MSLRIAQECPQCGGGLEMGETERLLRCGYCGVQSFLSNTGPLRFVLPRKTPDPYTIYAPYHRFKGTVYTCLRDRIVVRLADISARGVDLPFLPLSLGLRPQAMQMRFATPAVPGSFLKKSVPAAAILQRAAKHLQAPAAEVVYQACIGDVLNTIYLPLSIRNGEILDGIVAEPLARVAPDALPFAGVETEPAGWQPVFLPALCPRCGWNLAGEPDSIVLSCSNCSSCWQPDNSHFTEVEVRLTPAGTAASYFLPFWNFQVAVQGLRLDSFADLVRLTNQPLLIKPEWEDMEPCFVCPAFKVRPRDFLRLATQLTLGQRHGIRTIGALPGKNLHPVTLAPGDAEQGLPLVLANSAVSARNIFPGLEGITFAVKSCFLHFLPFEKMTHELRQPELGVTVNQRVLNYGRSL